MKNDKILIEFSNVLTQAFWAIWAIKHGIKNRHKTIPLAIFMHLPFSLMFHSALAVKKNHINDEESKNFRRLDQCFIVVACIFYALSLSGSVQYAFVVAAAVIPGIIELWYPSNTKQKRRILVLVATFLATLPILWKKGSTAFAKAIGTLWASFIPFIFGGWGHSVFHLGMIPYHAAIL